MINISVKADIQKARRHLTSLQKKQIPFAASVALNDTAFGLRKELGESTVKHMDRPTPFTQKGMRVTKSNKRNLRAAVFADPKRWKYLQKIVEGSSGQPRPVPVSAKTNAYGNLARNYVNVRKGKTKFFSGRPKGGGQSGLYERTNRNKKLKMHVAYEKSTKHRKTWPYHRIAETYVRRHFSKNMDRAMARAIATAR